MPRNAKVGLDMKLYRLPTTSTRASWGTVDSNGVHLGVAPAGLVEVDNVRDITPGHEKGQADTSIRGSKYRLRKGTLRDSTLEIQMVYDPDDANYLAFLRAFNKNEKIAMAVLDGEASAEGTRGFWADFEIFNFSDPQPLEDAVIVNITALPTNSDVNPEMVEVTGS